MPIAAEIVSAEKTTNLSAIVAGSTGAVGRELVMWLVADPTVGRVVALTRKPVPQEHWEKTWPKLDMELAVKKLKVSVMDWETSAKCFDKCAKADKKRAKMIAAGEIPPADPEVIPITGYEPADFEGHQFAANCLGTTFWKAKTLSKFYRVDHDYTITFMKLVMLHSGPGTRYSHISYNGANSHSILPYQRIKGKTDDEALQFGFEKVTVFRPGMLARRSKKRFTERLGTLFLLSKTPVDKVAAAMISEWRGLYELPAEFHHKIHNKYIYEAAGNYSARRCHEDHISSSSSSGSSAASSSPSRTPASEMRSHNTTPANCSPEAPRRKTVVASDEVAIKDTLCG